MDLQIENSRFCRPDILKKLTEAVENAKVSHVQLKHVQYMYTCTVVHAKIKAPLGSTNPMYCTCTRKPFANTAVSAETH